MTGGVVRVSYDCVYDLYFRVRNVKTEHTAYEIDFIDWVKAGVAFNVRGIEVSTRKISYFGDLYQKLVSVSDYSQLTEELKVAVTRYYEDLFLLYQDHLMGVRNAAGKKGRATVYLRENFVLLPSFKGVPKMQELFPRKEVDLRTYVPQNNDAMRVDMVHLYVQENSELYKCMAMYYDHSIKSDGNVVLLGVNEC